MLPSGLTATALPSERVASELGEVRAFQSRVGPLAGASSRATPSGANAIANEGERPADLGNVARSLPGVGPLGPWARA